MEIVMRGARLEERRARALGWTRTIKHRRCGSVLRVEAMDVTANSDWEGGWWYDVRCPACGARFWPWWTPIPDEVRELAEERTLLPPPGEGTP